MQCIDKLGSVITVDELAQMAKEEGVTVRSVLKVLADGMQSMVIPKLDNNGNVLENSVVPDMFARHKYMSSAMEILRLVRKETGEVVGTVEHKVASEDMDRLEKIAKELGGLNEKLNTQGFHKGTTIDADFTALQ